MNQGYTPKDLVFDQGGRAKLLSGIEKIAKAVKSTLGPMGQTVLVESPEHTHSVTVTKDGVTVAKAVDLLDPVENLAVRIMKDAAKNTASTAGDGTTTAIVLAEAIASQGLKDTTDGENIFDDSDKVEVIRHINKYTDDVIARLTKMSKKLTKSKMRDVATISANNDREIGDLITNAYTEVGFDGIVTVEKSMNEDTYAEVTHGIKIDRGYSSNLFVNNQKKDECVMENVYVLMTDHNIDNILQIEGILKPIVENRSALLIIGNCSQGVINTLAANVVKNGLKFCSVIPPQFGYKSHELMSDMAVALGGRYFQEGMGDDLSLINIGDLGKASKVIVGDSSTVIIRDQEKDEVVMGRVKELEVQYNNTSDVNYKKFLKERIACLNGGIGVIYVGGHSDVEQKEKFDRIDDAVCAVRSAQEEGILPGGGVALYVCAEALRVIWDTKSGAEAIALEILSEALEAPLRQILTNAGKDANEIICQVTGDKGYNVKTDEYGDMYKMGVIDPLKVTKNALKNAVSVATTIMSTNAIVTMARTYDTK
jgi:chaperonin GroEL